jgi:hypothetical protein
MVQQQQQQQQLIKRKSQKSCESKSLKLITKIVPFLSNYIVVLLTLKLLVFTPIVSTTN